MAGMAFVVAVAIYFLLILPRQGASQTADGTADQVAVPIATPMVDTNHTQRQVFVDSFMVSLEIDPQLESYLLAEGPSLLTVPPPEPTATTPLQPLAGVGSEPTQTTLTVPTVAPTVGPQAPQPTAVGVTSVQPIITVDYTVQANDTLYSVARGNAATVSLMAAYGIDSADIFPGTILKVPRANPAYCPSKGYRLAYIVREGDTAFSVARVNNVTLATLQQANSLDANYTIYTNQILCLP